MASISHASLFDVQRRRADRGARILLQPLHLGAETLIHHEPGTARADPVQRLHLHLFIGRTQLREQDVSIGPAPAPPALPFRHSRLLTLGPVRHGIRGRLASAGAVQYLDAPGSRSLP